MQVNKIYTGDCLEWLRQMPDNFIDCCVTSPPYYGLRDYGTAEWEGGDEGCDHKGKVQIGKQFSNTGSSRDNLVGTTDENSVVNRCLKCGATRIDNQIGLEETPEAYVSKLVEVFHEVKRVLKKEGTLWLNLGDSYCANTTGNQGNNTSKLEGSKATQIEAGKRPDKKGEGLKPKDLIGIPWMVAFALRADGYYLRQDLIWAKPNPMPESVTDRCTKAHEYIFLLSKSQKYYYDAEAIKQPMAESSFPRLSQNIFQQIGTTRAYGKTNGNFKAAGNFDEGTANKRSVWTVTTKPFSEAHFATFPEDLIIDCIKAGCPENGIVLDPFSGAGTTALVAKKLNRNYIGIELNETYVTMANRRLYNEIGLFL